MLLSTQYLKNVPENGRVRERVLHVGCEQTVAENYHCHALVKPAIIPVAMESGMSQVGYLRGGEVHTG